MYFLFPELGEGVTLYDIDEIIYSAIVVHEDIGIVNLILREDIFDDFFVEMGECFGAVEFNAAQFGRSNGDLRWIFIQTNAHLLQFSADLHPMLLCLSRLQHHQDHV